MTIVDAHIYVGDSLFGQGQKPLEVLKRMDKLGIDKSVLIANKPPDYDLWPANLYAAAAAALSPDRFFFAVRIDPWQRTSLSQLRTAHAEFGACGLVLHPWEENFQVSSDLVNPLFEYAKSSGIWIMIEAGYPLVSHPLDIAEVAHRHPEVNVIATHGLQLDSAGFALTDAELAMRECPNLYMETSGMYAPETMENIARDLGSQRLIFGSHSPWLNQQFELERVRALNLPAPDLNGVLGDHLISLMTK